MHTTTLSSAQGSTGDSLLICGSVIYSLMLYRAHALQLNRHLIVHKIHRIALVILCTNSMVHVCNAYILSAYDWGRFGILISYTHRLHLSVAFNSFYFGPKNTIGQVCQGLPLATMWTRSNY